MSWGFALAASLAFAADLTCVCAAEAGRSEPVVPALLEMGSRQAAPRTVEASNDGQIALRQMKPARGAIVTLWAAEPMLANPVAFAFDERGRAFVAETYRARTSALDIRDYPWMNDDDLACRTIEDRTALLAAKFGAAGIRELSQESELVRVLEDTDDDGVADATAVYATGFDSPLDGIGAGVLVRDGQVWFTNIPSFWKLSGDAKAETRQELSRGYGVRFGLGGHDLRSPIFGPDGKIYFCCGDRGAHVATAEGGMIDVPDSGAVFRCNPDGSRLELYAWGLCNPRGLCFNEAGDLFAADDDANQGDEERLVQIVEHGDSGWRVGYRDAPLGEASPWLAETMWLPRHWGQAASMIPPLCNIEDGPTGVAFYPGLGLPPFAKGAIFIAHDGDTLARSGIYSYQLKPEGTSYAVAEAAPLLLSAKPSALQFGPDCRLYFSTRADGGPKAPRGRIYAIGVGERVRDPFENETRRLLAEDFATEVPEELAHLLGHPDWRLRLKAQQALVGHGPDGFTTLESVLANQEAPARARLHATWAVGQLASAKPAAGALLLGLMRDADAKVRAQAAKLLGDCRTADALPSLVAALQDANPRVRLFAAQSLGHLGRPEAAGPLLALLRDNNDEDIYVRHAAVMGLVGCNNLGALAVAMKSDDRAERMGALLALRRLGRPEIGEFLGDSAVLIVREAARAINDEPIAAALPALAARIAQPVADEAVMVRVLNANFRLGQPANAEALATYAGRRDALASLRVEAIHQLAAWPTPPARDRVVGVFRPLPEAKRDPAVPRAALAVVLPALLAVESGSAVQLATLAAVESLDLRASAETLAAVVLNPKQPDAVRAGGLEALARWQDARLTALAQCAVDADGPLLKLAALPVVVRLMPDRAGALLERLVTAGDVTEQKGALSFLRAQPSVAAGALVAAQLEKLAAGHVAAAAQLELVQAAQQQRDPVVKKMLAVREAALAATGDPVAPFRIALEGGDAARGAQIFYRQPVRTCANCHNAGRGGGNIGPDLAAVGQRNPRGELLESIVQPSAKRIHGYETVTVTRKSGEITVGRVVRENAETLSVRRLDGRLVRLKKFDIVSRDDALSAMPATYPWTLTTAQIRDLVEFLASLKATPADLEADQQLRAVRPPPE